MLTVHQAAAILGVQPSTVRSWIHRGHITRQPTGLIANADLMRWWDATRRAEKATRGRR